MLKCSAREERGWGVGCPRALFRNWKILHESLVDQVLVLSQTHLHFSDI